MYLSSPLEQFTILHGFSIPLPYFDLSYTNASFLSTILLLSFLFLWKNLVWKSIPTLWQSFMENFFHSFLELFLENLGKNNKKYVPFFMTLFVLILSYNLVGMIPYQITVTSHLPIVLTFSLCLWMGSLLTAFSLHQGKFFSIFMPSESPLFLAPLLIFMEVISYLSKPLSLSMRLMANMMAGHILLAILTEFCWTLFTDNLFSTFLSLLPFTAIILIFFLEMAVSLIQSFVFLLLSLIYFKDSLFLH